MSETNMKKEKNNNVQNSTSIPGLENSTIDLNENSVNSFYHNLDLNINDYVNTGVIYLGLVGFYVHGKFKGEILKYGISDDVFRRDLEEHRETFGKQFKIIYVVPTNNKAFVENLFGNYMKVLGINKEMVFKNKNRKELFITTPTFSTENAKKILTEIVQNNPSKETQKKDDMIKELGNLCNNNILIEKEKTKQIEIECNMKIEMEKEKTKQLKVQLEILKRENKKEIKKEEVVEQKEAENIVKSDCLTFMEECTVEKSRSHIHCSDLHDRYVVWYKNKYPNEQKIPSNKQFIAELRLEEKKFGIIKPIKINNKSNLGVKNLALK